MSSIDGHPSTPEGVLEAKLAKLEAEERDVSAQRRRVFDRIDLGADDTRKDRLREKEQELSKRRRDLHGRIDALRAERDALYLARQLNDLEEAVLDGDRAPLEGTTG